MAANPHSSKKAFFRQGTKYRTPQFLATSFSKRVQTEFMKRRGKGLDAIRWYFHVPLGYCQHAALLEKSNMGKAEFEYLFTPFSVFTVMHVKWSEDPRPSEPHEIHLRCITSERGILYLNCLLSGQVTTTKSRLGIFQVLHGADSTLWGLMFLSTADVEGRTLNQISKYVSRGICLKYSTHVPPYKVTSHTNQ